MTQHDALPSPEQLQREIDALAIPNEQSRILLVDDEEGILSALSMILEDSGFPIDTAQTGVAGLEQLAATTTRVALVDKNLPDMTGIDVIRQGRLVSPETEFLMMTGYSSLESAMEAMDAGASGYIVKPFEMIEVTIKLMNAMQRNLTTYQNRQLLESFRKANRELFAIQTQHEMSTELFDSNTHENRILEMRLELFRDALEQAAKVLESLHNQFASNSRLAKLIDSIYLAQLAAVLDKISPLRGD